MAEPLPHLLSSLLLSLLAYLLTSSLIPRVGPNFVLKGLSGRDQLKPSGRGPVSHTPAKPRPGQAKGHAGATVTLGGKDIPEAMGVIAASVYVLLLSFFAPLPYYTHFGMTEGANNKEAAEKTSYGDVNAGVAFPHQDLATYLASLLSLLTATLLGFLDDVFDIRWRYKLPIPLIASVPLLVIYFAGHGVTDIVIPKLLGLRTLLGVEHVGGVLKLGPLYYFYMSLLSTFCTNSINILAGCNGVEVGQTLIIALSLVINDLLFLSIDLCSLYRVPLLGSVFSSSTSTLSCPQTFSLTNFARGSPLLADRHLFSLYLMLPLVGVCGGLLKHNWYPARAFVGDTFCYFAGMAFAVVGILGHFSKTLLLFFIPQIFNFLYSCPQLFGLIPCPRHRLPRYDPPTGLLHPSHVHFERPPSSLISLILNILSALRLVQVFKSRDGTILSCSNLTILNLILVVFGPMREPTLTTTLMAMQSLGSAAAFGIRYGGAGWFYDDDRR